MQYQQRKNSKMRTLCTNTFLLTKDDSRCCCPLVFLRRCSLTPRVGIIIKIIINNTTPFCKPNPLATELAPLPHISHTSPPLRFVAWCCKNVQKVLFHAIRVFLAILVERKTPSISTKGTERQKTRIILCNK